MVEKQNVRKARFLGRCCIGYIKDSREIGSVLRRIALRGCFGDSISSSIGDYKVAHAQKTESKFLPQNSSMVQFDTAPNQSPAKLLIVQWLHLCCSHLETHLSTVFKL